MEFTAFERQARSVWESIPSRYKAGVNGLIVDRAALAQRERPDVFTLGECVTEEYPSQYGGPETTRSAVVLYYGSFREVANESDDFDWEEEIHETIMHELQHHLESLAAEAALEDFDYAVDENFKRLQGESFDPFFFRAGQRIDTEGGITAYQVEIDVFLQLVTRVREAMTVGFDWRGIRYRVDLPAAPADVTFVYVENGPDVSPGEFWIVRVAERGVFATLRAAFGGGYKVDQATAVAEAIT